MSVKKEPRISGNGTVELTDAAILPEAKSVKKNRNKLVISNLDNSNDSFKKEPYSEKELLRVLMEVKNGNFAVRLPIDEKGMNGKICDTLNEIIFINEKMIEEFTKTGNTIGKQKKLTQRIELPESEGAWKEGVRSLNSLISDLVHPTIEIAQVIGSVAKGNPLQQMPQKIGGHLLEDEFGRIAKEVNDMVKQLNLFSMEVTRVAREVGPEGKLGGEAKEKGVDGVWQDLTDSVNQMGSNLTARVRNIAEVTTAVAKGDLSRKITVDVKGEILELKKSVFIELYEQHHKLIAQEQKLIAINKNLKEEINERKSSEEKVKRLNIQLLHNIDKLETANNDLDRFAFMASHDLQEPLRKIRTFGDRLTSKYKDIIDDDGKKYLERMQQSAQRMQLLIQDILTFSKISSREKTFIECDLNLLLNEVLSEFEPLVKDQNVTVEIENLPSLHANPGLIRPLFFNLISNSLKYCSKEAVPYIRIRTDKDHQSTDTKYCRIFFEDNGIGFDQKYADQVFRMFTRLHLDRNIEGTGIGLALCKKIVEEHNGFISVRSKINEGSTFIVSLPKHVQ